MRTNWFYTRIATEIERITQKPVVDPILLKEWQVFSDSEDEICQTGVTISDDVWNKFMIERYKITVEHMEKYLSLLEQIQPHMLPVLYHDNLLLQLLEVDY
jgi:hypothetical protein